MLILLGYISIAIIVSVYCVISSAVKVKIGHPPVGLLFFAYKYLFSGGNRNFRFLKKSKISRRTHKLVKLCYFSEWVSDFYHLILLKAHFDIQLSFMSYFFVI